MNPREQVPSSRELSSRELSPPLDLASLVGGEETFGESLPPGEMSLTEVQALILDTKREMLDVKRKKEDLLRRRKLWFFRPSPKQELFFEKSLVKRRAGYCGNRFGKSTLGVVEDCCWLIGYRPFFPEGHPLRYAGIPKHGVKGLVIAEEWDKVKEIFTNNDSADRLGKFFEFLPEDMIKKCPKNEKGVIVQIIVVSEIDGVMRESTVMFDTVKSYKQAPASFESSDWDFIHIDEPVPKDLWIAVSRGLVDRGGFAWWLLTPLKEVWMYNEMVENAKGNPRLYWWFEATMDDNPTLSEEDKELYLGQLPDDERSARRAGKPLAYGRLVYAGYEPTYHDVKAHPGWKNITRPPSDHMVVYAADTHPQTPHAALFVSVAPNGDLDFYEEIYEKGRIEDLCKWIKGKLADSRVQYGLCEPAAWIEDQGSGFCYADTFYQNGLDVIPGSKRKEDAVMLGQSLMRQRNRVVRIHERCKRLRWEMVNHYFDKSNRPEDKNDHMLECFRRLCIHDGLQFYPASFANANKPQQFTTERELKVGDRHTDMSSILAGYGSDLNLTRL